MHAVLARFAVDVADVVLVGELREVAVASALLQELVEGLLPRLRVDDRGFGQHAVEIVKATADRVGKAQWHSGIIYPSP